MLVLQVIVLQSYFRRWQARNLVNELKLDRDRRMAWERQEEIRKRREKEERIKKEFERRMKPKTKEDFDLLYAALESKHINNGFIFFRDLFFYIFVYFFQGCFVSVRTRFPQNGCCVVDNRFCNSHGKTYHTKLPCWYLILAATLIVKELYF